MSSECKPDLGQLHAPDDDVDVGDDEATSTLDIDFGGVDDDIDAETEAGVDSAAPLPPQAAPKRKGGRKPIYATSEERKQRNRQAQAAFRERRTEYIKQLEVAIRQHEENLQSLQSNHRAATDECLMLRYKNSLLERILLEKGIDVQAELHSKGEAADTRPVAAHVAAPPQPAQRMLINRQAQQALHRHPAGLAPKLHIKAQDGPMRPQHQHTLSSATSASSQLASPSTTFSTPPTAHPHSAAGSPSFSPHQEFYPTHHHRLSAQFPTPVQQAPQGQQSMTPVQFNGHTEAPQQHLDFSAPYQAYDMPESSYPAYPSWMDPNEMNNLGKLNPFLSPSITGPELLPALYDTIQDNEPPVLDTCWSNYMTGHEQGLLNGQQHYYQKQAPLSSGQQASYGSQDEVQVESYEDLVRDFDPSF